MTIFSFDNIKVLRTEITTVCNAKCSGCARKNLNSYQHMDQNIWENLISKENLINIDQIFFNGNYGDFSCHPNSVEFLSLIEKKEMEIIIATNGSSRSVNYWKDLADELKKFNSHLVIFAIDGTTQDVHSIHRENTNLEKILENASAFISQGGNASWQFITFQHNSHQIEEAHLLAKKYDFKEFILQNSYSPILKNSSGRDLYSLSTVEYLSKAYRYNFKFSYYKHIESGIISQCPWTKIRRLQINADGSVWPCCWAGELTTNVLNYDLKFFIPTLKDLSLKEIIESEPFQDFFVSQIQNPKSFCSLKCPAKYDDIKFRFLD